jgi:hypothetical protein
MAAPTAVAINRSNRVDQAQEATAPFSLVLADHVPTPPAHPDQVEVAVAIRMASLLNAHEALGCSPLLHPLLKPLQHGHSKKQGLGYVSTHLGTGWPISSLDAQHFSLCRQWYLQAAPADAIVLAICHACFTLAIDQRPKPHFGPYGHTREGIGFALGPALLVSSVLRIPDIEQLTLLRIPDMEQRTLSRIPDIGQLTLLRGPDIEQLIYGAQFLTSRAPHSTLTVLRVVHESSPSDGHAQLHSSTLLTVVGVCLSH